jgi:hypothetical protein
MHEVENFTEPAEYAGLAPTWSARLAAKIQVCAYCRRLDRLRLLLLCKRFVTERPPEGVSISYLDLNSHHYSSDFWPRNWSYTPGTPDGGKYRQTVLFQSNPTLCRS